jgi:hypothetical protein
MTPEEADRLLDRAAAWLAARARTPGLLPFVIDVEPEAERVRLQTWAPSPLDQDLRRAPDSEAREIARLFLLPGLPLQIADHGARTLLVGRGHVAAAWVARRRPHLSLPVVTLSTDDRFALSQWLAQAGSDGLPVDLQDGSAHNRLRRAALVPPMPADLEARVRARFPRLAVVPGIRATALVYLPHHASPKILSLA